jgi:hypothetical protein
LKLNRVDGSVTRCHSIHMPTRASKRRDFSQIAKAILDAATGDGPAILPPGSPPENDARNPHAVALSKLGASKGGKARASALSPAKRKAIAKRAAAKRWAAKTNGADSI